MCIKCKLFGWLPDFLQPKCTSTKPQQQKNDLIFNNYNSEQTKQNPHAPRGQPDDLEE